MKVILTPIDFSDISQRVIESAATLARALDGHIILLNVVQPPPAIGAADIAFDDLADLTAIAEKEADSQLVDLQKGLAGKSISAEVLRLNGAPAAEIVNKAKELLADYIVIGSHGHTAVYELLIGSTARNVLKRSPCPVLVVPPAKGNALERSVAKSEPTTLARP